MRDDQAHTNSRILATVSGLAFRATLPKVWQRQLACLCLLPPLASLVEALVGLALHMPVLHDGYVARHGHLSLSRHLSLRIFFVFDT